jgi:5-methylcytosine-specific restriction endonuclease McrA
MPSSDSRKRELSRIRNARYRERNGERIKQLRLLQLTRETPEHREERIRRRRVADKRRYSRNRQKVLARKAMEYRADKDKFKERNLRFYKDNMYQQRERARKYRVENQEKVMRAYAAYAKRRPEVYRAAANRRRARLANASGDFTNEQWLTLCEKYGNKCACCEQEKRLHADHIVPLSKGGSNMIENIQPLCKSCNSRKATKTIAFRRPVADASNAILRLA